MGIYVFDTDVLVPALEADARAADQPRLRQGHHPAADPKVPVYSYRFYDENKKAAKYWRDIGTLDAYFEANMDLCQVNPEFNLYDPEWPLRTYQPQAPPAKFVFAEKGSRCGQALDSVISAGCIVSGSRIRGSVLCPNVRVHSFCRIEQSILMPGVRVGRHARIRRAIIDRDVLIPRGALIGYNPRKIAAATPSPTQRHRRRHNRRRAVDRPNERRSAAVRGRGRPARRAKNERRRNRMKSCFGFPTGPACFVNVQQIRSHVR